MVARAEITSSSANGSTPPGTASPGLPLRGGVRLRALVLIRWAAVAGQLFIRASERAERIYAAMCARGLK